MAWAELVDRGLMYAAGRNSPMDDVDNAVNSTSDGVLSDEGLFKLELLGSSCRDGHLVLSLLIGSSNKEGRGRSCHDPTWLSGRRDVLSGHWCVCTLTLRVFDKVVQTNLCRDSRSPLGFQAT